MHSNVNDELRRENKIQDNTEKNGKVRSGVKEIKNVGI